MKISTKGRYAVRALTYLVNLYNKDKEKTASIKEISSFENISTRYLENIFVKLKRSGILESIKGEKGGFRLTRDPKSITILQVLEVVESQFSPTKCLINPKICPRAEKCGTRKIWAKLHETVSNFLDGITLDEVTKLHTQ